MACEFVNQLASGSGSADGEGHGKEPCGVQGVVAATVLNNVDALGLGRVQIQIPGQANMPWARVATPMAGLAKGMYFMPQIGDEVLVAFGRGDTEEPYVIGCLWNGVDRPPILGPQEAVTKRVIRTIAGHEIEFDDVTMSVTITSPAQHKVTVGVDGVELNAGLGAAKVTADVTGRVALDAKTAIDISAPVVKINGKALVDIKSGGSVAVDGGPHCTIKGGLVEIN